MAGGTFDDLHNHATWGPHLRPEFVEPSRLHRHRISDHRAVPRFTTWEHNGPNHSHRLPDGVWTRPRVDLRPPSASRELELGVRSPAARARAAGVTPSPVEVTPAEVSTGEEQSAS